tara:strand:- start:764 stop:1024 length:261 start_codon:yes stop_codon:yes gene_type:complete
MTVEFLRFDPSLCPADIEGIPKFIDNMFLEIAAVLEVVRDGHLDVSNIEPTKPQQGDIRYADGTNWNPGAGEGIYFRNAAAAWVKL